ncbi:MAG: acyl-CoA dehydrogenase [Gammaproteobacteria bacterium]|nr:acyl-CoA dehydrogenase [Gammaproteobacteria bacterium]NIP87968.1 acyl-CoA dehydrogenase [Gammaproteobacteria bacterium]NIR22126.1 acyl-CoA dehydrogenase [Gammaproteobacteria bacterium]NIS03808.1 acyl-CoA dehydrogenase [Gammaproteobacteria bacterium]NIU42248.1 acyl-CoA dehydrogenase [Gammaproteobacteria bacterium]
MPAYTAPLEDMRFVVHELLADERLQSLPGNEEFSADVLDAVLEEAARFCASVLQPLNRSGDEQGCLFENGVVRTPDGFKDAYREFAAGGWTGLAADNDYGGQGLPETMDALVNEMLCASNLSFAIYPGLSHGAYRLIRRYASEAQRNAWLPPLVEGRWSGTMCLTEPQCGTDLGLIRTHATPRGDDVFALNGAKCFISAGEHDLTENILHLVLARTPDAPPGTGGLSVFLVPKFTINADGTLGPRNGITCGNIEHKMGLNASATCTLNFDDAQGFLVGGLHQGMRVMFTMMNGARLAVALHGIGIAEAAYQGAVAYARERRQGRALDGPRSPEQAADSILVHPDVRRMLLGMRSQIEGARALSTWVAARYVHAQRNPDAQARDDAHDLVSLLTPILKAYCTDMGSEAANLGVQIYGGHGYIREHGMEQLVRDARVCQIYEGANGVQAMDLVGRKLPAHAGRYLRRFFQPVAAFIADNSDNGDLTEFVAPLSEAFALLQKATRWIAENGTRDPNEAGAAASEYLRLFALVAMAFMWARMARIALASESKNKFYRGKLATARFYMQRVLPQTASLYACIVAGGSSIADFEDEAF